MFYAACGLQKISHLHEVRKSEGSLQKLKRHQKATLLALFFWPCNNFSTLIDFLMCSKRVMRGGGTLLFESNFIWGLQRQQINSCNENCLIGFFDWALQKRRADRQEVCSLRRVFVREFELGIGILKVAAELLSEL